MVTVTVVARNVVKVDVNVVVLEYVVVEDIVELVVLCADMVVTVPTMKSSVDLPVQVTVVVLIDVEVPVVVTVVVVLVEEVVVLVKDDTVDVVVTCVTTVSVVDAASFVGVPVTVIV